MSTVRKDANIIERRLELEFIENLGIKFFKYPLFKISTFQNIHELSIFRAGSPRITRPIIQIRRDIKHNNLM